jgi:hypothetical protein
MSHISIRNIYGKNAPRIPEYNKGDNSYYPFSFIWVDGDLDIDFLSIDNLCRKEDIADVETLKVCKNAYIKMLSLSNILHQNVTDKPITMFTNEGVIDKLYMYNVDAIKDIERDFEETIKISHKVTLDDIKKENILTKFVGKILKPFAPLM